MKVNKTNISTKDVKSNEYYILNEEKFIEKNYFNIDLNNKNVVKQFGVLDDDAKKNDVFLAGEYHAISMNYDLKLALLKYLNNKANVNYLLIEFPYSDGCYINRYLQTGNEENLKLIYNNFKNTLSYSKEDYNFWIKLREYNNSLPENRKIKVIGIDIEHQLNTACTYISLLFLPNNTPQSIKSDIDRLNKDLLNANPTNVNIQLLLSFKEDVDNNESTYKKYLGSHFFDFIMVLDNMINSVNAYKANSPVSEIRERSIYNNFIKIYEHLPKGKFFGQFGDFHAIREKRESVGSFAMRLNQEGSHIRGKVISIAYDYRECYFMDNKDSYRPCPIETNIISDRLVNKFLSTDATIFKLNGKISPFNSKSNFIDEKFAGRVTDYFEYVVLIRNSKAAIPYN